MPRLVTLALLAADSGYRDYRDLWRLLAPTKHQLRTACHLPLPVDYFPLKRNLTQTRSVRAGTLVPLARAVKPRLLCKEK